MNLQDYWRVLKVKSQHEINVVSNLNKLGIDAYTPFLEQIRQWSDRKKKIKKVLISRHVFVKLSKDDEYKVFESSGVLGYLSIHGQRAKVWPNEINNLKNYCNKEYQQDNLSVGETLKIPVLGSFAEVVKVDNNNLCSVISDCGRFTIKFKLAS